MSDLLIKGGLVIDPVSGTEETQDVRIEGGVVAELGRGLKSPGEVIDGVGAVVAPGFVDMHVHLREPGREDEETIESGSAAAALGGFNAVCAMPNTDPPCDNAAVAEKIAGRGDLVGLVKVFPAGALTKGRAGSEMAPIGEMARSAAGVRIFTDDGAGVQNASLMRRAMEYARAFDVIVANHCEDASLSEGGSMHEGEFSSLLGLEGIPAEAEETMLARDLALARLTGARYHAMHISTAGSVDLIRFAKARGASVTAEATPHHASLTDAELMSYDTNFKVNPPLRTAADVEAIRTGLADGTIDAIATDHAPHAPEEKEAEFELAPPGLIGLETALGVVINELVSSGILTLIKAVELLSTRPARILGLDGFGGPIAAGAPANLVVFDPESQWQVDAAAFASLCRNTPWAGRMLRGRVLFTILRGRIVAAQGRLADRASA